MSTRDRLASVNTSPPTDENRHEEREMITSTLNGLNEIAANFQEKFSNVDREIVSIHREINENTQKLQTTTNENFDSLFNELKELKKDLENKFKDLRELIGKNFASSNQE